MPWGVIRSEGSEYSIVRNNAGALADWQPDNGRSAGSGPDDAWSVGRLWAGQVLLNGAVEINPSIRGGVPVFRGTRIPIAQMIAEVADGRGIAELADAFDLDVEQLKSLFDGLAITFDRSFVR